MAAVAWTAMGVEAVALVAMVCYLGKKLDRFEAKLAGHIDAVIARIDAQTKRATG